MYKNFYKRLIDFFVSLLGLVLLLPIIIAITFFLTIVNEGKPFFFQRRPGKNGKIFKIIKFKTMNDKKNPDGSLMLDAERLTIIGSIVRKTSLDEIPQLINVLKGEMSLIGPRPLLEEYLPLYDAEQRKRHNVKPGITGWAQVNGRNAISWKEKFILDFWYVQNISFPLDCKIILLTIKKVLKSEGISSESSLTMEAFEGEN
jgi:undecaprenyl phosphate N,N'-diacetylbacillosamine 1-phosphate transferase